MKDNAVLSYTHGIAVLDVPFPEEKTICQWCPFIRAEDSIKRHRCLLTGEYLVYPFSQRGQQCPVTFGSCDSGVNPM